MKGNFAALMQRFLSNEALNRAIRQKDPIYILDPDKEMPSATV